MQHFDVSRLVGADASGISRELRAQLDDLASERLAMVQTGSLFITDVRKLPDDAGFLGAKYQDASFVTVLEDGFVVSTDATIGVPNLSRRLQLFGTRKLDPGYFVLFVADLADAQRAHVERVAQFSAARRTAIRRSHDRDLYFEFRRKRSAQIRRRALLQVVPWTMLQIVGLSLLTYNLAMRFPLGKPPLRLFLWMLAASVGTFALCFVLGAIADTSLRGTKPMLPPS